MPFQDQLAQAAKSVGKITTVPGAEGADTTYKTDSGAYAEKVGDGRYRVPILDSVDEGGTPGRGAYWAEYDSQGNMVRQPYYQQTTNHDWSGLVAFAATALGSFALSQAGLGAAAQTSSIADQLIAAGVDPALAGTQAGALVNGMGTGSLAAIGAALKAIPSAALGLIKGLLPDSVKGLVDNLTGAGMLGLAGDAIGGSQLLGASNTAADAFNTLGNQNFNDYIQHAQNIDNRTQGIGNTLNDRYKQLGTDASGMLGNLATQAKGDYNALGGAAAGVYNGVAGGNKAAYDSLLTDLKGSTEKFTPWNVTTNVGSTNKGIFTPTTGTQNVSDQATAAAGASFGAANNIDVNNLAAQKFGQQQAMLAPYDAKALAELRANLAATGRTGVASNATGQAISPELAAYYLSKGTRDQGLLTNADQAALNVRQGLIGQGVSASGVPLNIGAHGLSQIGTGVSAGAQQASTNNSLASTIANLGSRGIDTTTNAQLHGADQTLPIFQNAVSVPLGLQKEGIGTMLSQGNKGLEALTGQLNMGTNAINDAGNSAIRAKYGDFIRSIDQRYQGNFQKAALLTKLFSSLGGMTQKVSQAASQGDVAALATQLLKAGVPQTTIDGVLNGQVSGGAIFNPNGTSTTWGNTTIDPSVYDSIWGF